MQMNKFTERMLKRLDLGSRIVSGNLQIVHTQIDGTHVMFCVDMENDPIQRNHKRGNFYEQNELKLLHHAFKKGGVFVDIGANVGNHSLYCATFLKPSKIIPCEPNPKAIHLLVHNMLVNGHRDIVDFNHLGIGIGRETDNSFAVEKRTTNLGAAKLLKGQGDLTVLRGDAVLQDVTPDFIKIDVEGMELDVLAGLSGVFDRCHPNILIEVDNENDVAFMDWAKRSDYKIIKTLQRYRTNKNHLIAHKSVATKLKAKLKKTEAENA